MESEVDISPIDEKHLRSAIRLANEAERKDNLPIGAVIALDGQVVAEGANAIWEPVFDATRHAEIEAIRAVPRPLWPQSREMTLYTTLEPCVMCAGAILLHDIGRVVYGAADNVCGVSPAFPSLPPYFASKLAGVNWQGPVLPLECDQLFRRAQVILADRADRK